MKYESLIFCCSSVMTKVQVLSTDDDDNNDDDDDAGALTKVIRTFVKAN